MYFKRIILKFAVRAFGVLIASVGSQLLLRAQFVVSQILRGTQDSLVDIPLGDSRHGEQVANYAIVGHGSMKTILEV